MQKKLSLLVAATFLGLAGCNTGTDIERALVGGAIGCAAGEILEDGECITGAAIGATAGALSDNI